MDSAAFKTPPASSKLKTIPEHPHAVSSNTAPAATNRVSICLHACIEHATVKFHACIEHAVSTRCYTGSEEIQAADEVVISRSLAAK